MKGKLLALMVTLIVTITTLSVSAAEMEILGSGGTETIEFNITSDSISLNKWSVTVFGETAEGQVDSRYDFQIEPEILVNETVDGWCITVNEADFNTYEVYWVMVDANEYIFYEKFDLNHLNKTQNEDELVTYRIIDGTTGNDTVNSVTVFIQDFVEAGTDFKVGHVSANNGNIYLPENDYTFYIMHRNEADKKLYFIYSDDVKRSRTIDISKLDLFVIDINLPENIICDDVLFSNFYSSIREQWGEWITDYQEYTMAVSDNIYRSSVWLVKGGLNLYYYKDITPGQNPSIVQFNVGTDISGDLVNCFNSETNWFVYYEIRDVVDLKDEYGNEVVVSSNDTNIYRFSWLQGEETVLSRQYERDTNVIDLPHNGNYTLNIEIDLGDFGVVNLSEEVNVSDWSVHTNTDVNLDSIVNLDDLVLVKNKYSEYTSSYDLYSDGFVDAMDLIKVLYDNGKKIENDNGDNNWDDSEYQITDSVDNEVAPFVDITGGKIIIENGNIDINMNVRNLPNSFLINSSNCEEYDSEYIWDVELSDGNKTYSFATGYSVWGEQERDQTVLVSSGQISEFDTEVCKVEGNTTYQLTGYSPENFFDNTENSVSIRAKIPSDLDISRLSSIKISTYYYDGDEAYGDYVDVK